LWLVASRYESNLYCGKNGLVIPRYDAADGALIKQLIGTILDAIEQH